MKLEFDKTFSIPTNSLYLNRAHPFIKRDRKWLIQFTIVHGQFTTVMALLAYNIINYDLKINNFTQTCKNIAISVIYVVITFQYLILLWHQDSFLDLIRNMNRDYEQSEKLPPIEKSLLNKYVKESLWVCKQWQWLAILGSSVFVFKSVGLMLYYYCIGEFRLVPIYDLVWYPSIIENNKDNIYIFLLTNGFLIIYDIYAAIMFAGYVPLGPISILHACGQMEIVRKRIDDLFVERDDKIIREKLISIIGQLQYIYSFVDRINKIFKVAYELTLKATTIMLPITCYEVLEAFNQGEVSLEFITFIFGGTLFSSSPCYYSDLLMEKGEKLCLALYTCGWELYADRRTRKTLQMMMQLTHRPIAIRTVFRPLSLVALTELFQQAYGIFNLMNAMWN